MPFTDDIFPLKATFFYINLTDQTNQYRNNNIIVNRDLYIQIQAILETKAKSGDRHIIPKPCKQLTAFKN